MKTRLFIAYVGNIVDTASTLYLFGKGHPELNPLMAWLLQCPLLFGIVKICTMTVVIVLLWMFRKKMCSLLASWVAALVYGAIAVYYSMIFTLLP